jgi:hypothetical protein
MAAIRFPHPQKLTVLFSLPSGPEKQFKGKWLIVMLIFD